MSDRGIAVVTVRIEESDTTDVEAAASVLCSALEELGFYPMLEVIGEP